MILSLSAVGDPLDLMRLEMAHAHHCDIYCIDDDCGGNLHISPSQVALDEEVSSEQAEAFRKQLARVRHPEHATMHFALAPRPGPKPPAAVSKHNTLKSVLQPEPVQHVPKLQ